MGVVVRTLCIKLSHPVTNLDNYCTISIAVLLWLLLRCNFNQCFLWSELHFTWGKQLWLMPGFFLVADNNTDDFRDVFACSGVVMKSCALAISPSEEKDRNCCCLSLSVLTLSPPTPSFPKKFCRTVLETYSPVQEIQLKFSTCSQIQLLGCLISLSSVSYRCFKLVCSYFKILVNWLIISFIQNILLLFYGWGLKNPFIFSSPPKIMVRVYVFSSLKIWQIYSCYIDFSIYNTLEYIQWWIFSPIPISLSDNYFCWKYLS